MTAGNASGVNDGAAAMILASDEAVSRHGLTPRARVLGMASAGVAAAHHGDRPGAGDAASSWSGWASRSRDFDVIELNEAFAARRSPCCASSALPTTPST